MNIWSRLGISVALAAIFFIAATELLQSRAYYEVYRGHICLGLGVGGTFLWLFGVLLRSRPAVKMPIEVEHDTKFSHDEEPAEDDQVFFFSPRYWAPLLM